MTAPPRVVLAKTALDGHWRGVSLVASALSKAGFEVVMLGSATAEQIARAAIEEDADIVGLNIGGRIEVVKRVIMAIRASRSGVPIIAGGVISPDDAAYLESMDVRCFPPGSPLCEIVSVAERLVYAANRASRSNAPA